MQIFSPIFINLFFYFRQQRAKGACLHVHLSTAAKAYLTHYFYTLYTIFFKFQQIIE